AGEDADAGRSADGAGVGDVASECRDKSGLNTRLSRRDCTVIANAAAKCCGVFHHDAAVTRGYCTFAGNLNAAGNNAATADQDAAVRDLDCAAVHDRAADGAVKNNSNASPSRDRTAIDDVAREG